MASVEGAARLSVVLDTNVLFSAITVGGLPRVALLGAVLGVIECVSSPFILDELRRKLIEKAGYTEAAAAETVQEVAGLGRVVTPGRVEPIVRDADDDHIIAAAVEAGVDVIVTGDTDLLDLGSHRGIRIVTPRAFLDDLGVET